MSDQKNLMRALIDLLDSEETYSDILLESGVPAMVKTSRGWFDAGLDIVPTIESIGEFLAPVAPGWKDEIKKGALNKRIDLENWRLRINAYNAYGGEKLMASVRRIPHKPPTLQQTRLPTPTRLLLESPRGIILISGATGSGKTTSMAAMLEVLNEMRRAHIITIEDPIEFVFERKNSIFSQREIGVDCQSFYEGVRDAMRQCPDVIVIGEIRDRDTAEQALLAGESGHLVIGTLHANSACGTISKMLGFFGGNEQPARLQSLSGSLVGIINQTLIPKKASGGYAMAVDFLANNKRQYSRILSDLDKVQTMLDHGEDGLSLGLGNSIRKLVTDGVVEIADAAKVASGNAVVYDKIKGL